MKNSCDISWFIERDIDIWLSEELRVNPAFARWFAARAGLPEQALFPATRTQPSVVDETGETDVEAIFGSQGNATFALLVENKITAGFQRDQIARYIRRGEIGVERGKWTEFAVTVFAPRQYATTGLPENVRAISFEDAAEFLRTKGGDLRTVYRADFLERAARGKIFAVEDYDPFRIEWWNAVDDMVRREFGDFFLIARRDFPKSTYINPKCPGMPSYLRVDLKGHLGHVDLSFRNVPLDALASAVADTEGPEFKLIENSKSSAVRIAGLQPFLVGDGLGIIESRVRSAYEAAFKLLGFWKANRDIFDRLASEANRVLAPGASQ